MSDQTEQAMLAAIRTHIKAVSGKEPFGAIVILADTTPLDRIEDSTSGDFYHYKHGGFFACEGLLSLTRSATSLEDEQGDDQ